MDITGSVESIRFRNPENGWTVLLLETDSVEYPSLTVVGTLPECSPGEQVSVSGTLTEHPKYGLQLKAESCRILAPSSTYNLYLYLSSGIIKGIGESMAETIVDTFGMDTMRIFDEDPEKLLSVKGIGRKRLKLILDSYQETRTIRNVFLALEPLGLTSQQCLLVYHTYGDSCVETVLSNPYRLVSDIPGIGFQTADRIARTLPGFAPAGPERIRAGLLFSMETACNEYGHTYLPVSMLLPYASNLLGVDPDSVEEEMDFLCEVGRLVAEELEGTACVLLPAMYRYETEIASQLVRMSEIPVPSAQFRAEALIQSSGMELSRQQHDAILKAISSNLVVITGGPGTGKTTIIRFIATILEDGGCSVSLAAPTGRAAKRISEATGFPARTIHRLLEYVPESGFLRNADNPLSCDALILDEASMIDIPLMHAVLDALPVMTRLIIVGDANQLPPVGPGNTLKDILRSEKIPSVRLTEIFRQAKLSRIIRNAHLILHGEIPDLEPDGSDFLFEETEQPDRIRRQIIREAESALEAGLHLNEFQVLAPMKKGSLGVFQLNRDLQEALNPPDPGKREHLYGSVLFREGDRVMQIKNNYLLEWERPDDFGAGVFNGDLGTIEQILPADRIMQVYFDDGRTVRYDFGSIGELAHAFCISIHKSQGSEFDTVCMPAFSYGSPLLSRNLLYTAVTRAVRKFICIGSRAAVESMVRNNNVLKRYSALKLRILSVSVPPGPSGDDSVIFLF